jgi:hypothetical protein
VGSTPTARTKPGKHNGVAMPDDNELFDEDGQEALDEFDRLTQLLSQHVVKFAEDEDIPDEMLSPLLLRIALTSRMVGYLASTAKPSAGGLKLDLDRFRRDVDDIIRETKRMPKDSSHRPRRRSRRRHWMRIESGDAL